jgi:hypothetical protein
VGTWRFVHDCCGHTDDHDGAMVRIRDSTEPHQWEQPTQFVRRAANWGWLLHGTFGVAQSWSVQEWPVSAALYDPEYDGTHRMPPRVLASAAGRYQCPKVLTPDGKAWLYPRADGVDLCDSPDNCPDQSQEVHAYLCASGQNTLAHQAASRDWQVTSGEAPSAHGSGGRLHCAAVGWHWRTYGLDQPAHAPQVVEQWTNEQVAAARVKLSAGSWHSTTR